MFARPAKTSYLSMTLSAALFVSGGVIFSATATGARVWNSKTKQLATNKPDQDGAQAAPTPRIKAVYFRITPRGIDPSQLTLPAGRYLVAIDNDSGFTKVDVKLDKEGGPRLENAQLPLGRRKWRRFVEFTPGRYVFTDPGDAKRVCRLTITNK